MCEIFLAVYTTKSSKWSQFYVQAVNATATNVRPYLVRLRLFQFSFFESPVNTERTDVFSKDAFSKHLCIAITRCAATLIGRKEKKDLVVWFVVFLLSKFNTA